MFLLGNSLGKSEVHAAELFHFGLISVVKWALSFHLFTIDFLDSDMPPDETLTRG